MMRFLKQILLGLFLSVSAGVVCAQNIEYGAELDTTYMMIGDQQHLSFKVKSDVPLRILFPQLKDTVSAGIEIISGPVRDSLKGKDGKWLYEERYVITVFDTGVYMIPQMPITVENDNYNNILRTDPLGFVVNTYQVEESKGNYDIVSPYDAPWSFMEILPYVLWTLLGLVVIAVVVWLVIRYRKHKPLFQREEVVIPPYVVAIQSLDRLKDEKLWQSGRVKEYYTKLTDTVRQYIDGELGIAAMEQTSFEILRALENNDKVEAQEREKLTGLLQTADFVKFAKATPLPNENAHNLDIAYEFVNHTNQKIKQEQQKLEAQMMKAEEEETEKLADAE
ncbi:hypothetical protein [Culturomica massiliensis]|uniref:hypothetical protein n=1 Tax=Culturomica massiliensis TaxID=1841857 RepID=UPI000ABE16FE|nr:hypothetical protein [Culturomica massiliensis]